MINYNSLFLYLDIIKYNNNLKYNVIRSFVHIFLKIRNKKTILFIFGVQRSGTSVTFHSLRKLFGVKGYNEFSELTVNGLEKLRFPEFSEVQTVIRSTLHPYVVSKPLVESQQANIVLSKIQNSRGLWMYRNYKDVVNSFHKKFGDGVGHHHLDLIREGQNANWRAERVPNHLKELVEECYTDLLSNQDATALYWFVRNSLYFEYDFKSITNLKLLKYEHFMLNTDFCISRICDLWDYNYQLNFEKLQFNTDSINKGKNVELSPKIDVLCEGLLSKMDKEFLNQNFFVR